MGNLHFVHRIGVSVPCTRDTSRGQKHVEGVNESVEDGEKHRNNFMIKINCRTVSLASREPHILYIVRTLTYPGPTRGRRLSKIKLLPETRQL